MKTKISVFFVAMLLSGILHSQILSPSVISSAGGFYTSATAMLSFTVSEMTMVQTFSSPGNILTQGFQQAEDLAVDIPENDAVTGNLTIYPNPTNGTFTLSYYSSTGNENKLLLRNLTGQVVLTKSVTQSVGINTVYFDIGNYSQGIYILEFMTVNDRNETKINYHKINLVY